MGWSNLWTTPSFKSYLQFVTLNYGLEGLFSKRTPREMLEGFIDPLQTRMYNTPVYIIGGDQIHSTNISIANMTMSSYDNSVSFFTG